MNKNGNGLNRMKQSQQDRMLNLKHWREQQLHEETLPSGLDVLLRDADLASVMLEGGIPNTLIDLITSDDFQKMSPEEAGKAAMSGDMGAFNTLLRKVAEAVLADPMIGDVADDRHILYSELTLEDKLFVFTFASRDAQKVRSFRDE